MIKECSADQRVASLLDRPVSRRGVLMGLLGIMAAGAVTSLASACAPQQAPPAAPGPGAVPSDKGAAQPAPGGAPAAAKPAEGAKPAGEPKKGGTLKVAILGEPPALDSMFTTATVTADTSWHIMEGLFSRGAKQEPVPQLLEKYEPSSDGKSAMLSLRKGVPFHNDREMTSADVVASLKRWGAIAVRG